MQCSAGGAPSHTLWQPGGGQLLNDIKIGAPSIGAAKSLALGGPVGLWIFGTSQFNLWTSGFWNSDLGHQAADQAHQPVR